MGDNFFQFSENTINVFKFSGVAILGYLAGKLIEIIVQRNRDDRQEFRSAYAEFSKYFTGTLQQLETGESTLNALILAEFSNQDLAMRDFIRHLSKARKNQFFAKWREYEGKYYEIKNLGFAGICCAIAPSEEELTGNVTPQDMERWELDRRKEIHKIIGEFLVIAEEK
jgi:hypothetical protein